jgi:transcription-repair coupling factor (superfamily II helicase)
MFRHSTFDIFDTSEILKVFEADQSIQLNKLNLSGLALLASNMLNQTDRDIVLLCPKLEEAERLRDDVETILTDRFCFFPPDELLPFDKKEMNPSILSLRYEALLKLQSEHNHLLISDIRSVVKKTIAPGILADHHLEISVGDELDFETFIFELDEYGYQRTDTVEQAGSYSVRGGIIDIYTWIHEEPYRIEFFGDDIESIRTFDIVNQRSTANLEKISIYPYHFENHDKVSLFEHMENPIYILIEPDLIKNQLDMFINEIQEIASHKSIDSEEIQKNYVDEKHVLEAIESHFMCFALQTIKDTVAIDTDLMPNFEGDGQFETYIKYQNALSEEMRVVMLCDHESQKDRFMELCDDANLQYPQFIIGSFHYGVSIKSQSMIFINEHDVFKRYKRTKSYKKFKRAEALRSLNFLNFNDYIVHIDYGIGQFKGLRKLKINNIEKETLHIEYDGGDKVYVNIDKIQRIQKYSSEDGISPKLTKLGGKDWDRIKQKTRKQVEVIADELVELYAERHLTKGFQYSQDGKWQTELEASFDYTDTEDQAKATIDVKEDMESPKSMDRLVCGDVGFGKTEIAVRAAFKAVQDSKQVAVLVPTTILAQQHFETFQNRMKNYPVKIELLSRFRTATQQKKVVQRLAEGDVDIVIGTHRLTSKDIQFKDLGLIVIDEEQRFGVKHKEKLKELKKGVDVLTLSATPIPRTLQQALVGVRSISNIETPPVNRLPIMTEIITWNHEDLYKAIMREIDRGGQIFFVHNRIQTIEEIKQMILKIVPTVTIEIGHGQMKESELAKVMDDFKHHKFDILLSTMIIENGLDIPNVNTILVNHAERFGLSQMYQLRGRVGRSDRQAYCYLITPLMNKMTDTAIKRLYALEEFSELGSGIKVSMRDLEIRGAGSLLGHQQSGHIEAVGYDLYISILEEAIADLKAKIDQTAREIALKRKIDTQFDVDLDCYIPHFYVKNAKERVAIYHRFVKCDNADALKDMIDEMTDRFGKAPVPAQTLYKMIEIRNLANRLAISKVDIAKSKLIMKFHEESASDQTFIQMLIQRFMSQELNQIAFNDTNGFSMTARLNTSEIGRLDEVIRFLSAIEL